MTSESSLVTSITLIYKCILPLMDILVASEATDASEVTSDLGFEISDLNYICYCVSLASKGPHELNETEEMYDP